MSRFDNVEIGPPIEPFALTRAYSVDTFSSKVNLGVGAYRTDSGHPWVLPCVRKAEAILAADDTLDHEYLPVLGFEPFCKAATKLLLGKDLIQKLGGKVFSVQSLSGTGCLRVAAEFLKRTLKYKTVYISNPTWENHKMLFSHAGFSNVSEYRYWDSKTRGLDFEGMLEDLSQAPANTIVVLHVCAHNPTGCDPTREQWKQIAEVIKEKKLFTLFDSAYLGFATGDADDDAWPVRHFVESGLELMCAQSFAKNFGLYNERVGNLVVVVNNLHGVEATRSQLTIIVRGMYSNPPSHGAKVVSLILNTPNLKDEWKECIKIMSGRIKKMREELRNRLENLSVPGKWDHITSQIGLFSYTGLDRRQAEHLVKKYHIYMLRSGRINMCGLTMDNIDHVAQSIYQTVAAIQPQSSKF